MSGKIKVTGYGTIKIKVTDDNGKKHDLIIHNVLYVPQSPINLISPQKWSQGMHDNGTGEITVGDATLLFWDNRKYTKLIPHQPEYGIPIMSVNDGFTKSNAFFTATKEFSSMYCHGVVEVKRLSTSGNPMKISLVQTHLQIRWLALTED